MSLTSGSDGVRLPVKYSLIRLCPDSPRRSARSLWLAPILRMAAMNRSCRLAFMLKTPYR